VTKFNRAPGGEQLVARQKAFDDNPTPSGNSMLAYVLLRLARIYGDDELERRAVGVLRLFGESLGRGPPEFAWALNALDLYLATPKEIAIVGPPDSPVARAALEPFEPNAVVAFGPTADVPLLEGDEWIAVGVVGLGPPIVPFPRRHPPNGGEIGVRERDFRHPGRAPDRGGIRRHPTGARLPERRWDDLGTRRAVRVRNSWWRVGIRIPH